MNRRFLIGLTWCCVGGVVALPATAIDIALVPAGGDGQEIAIDPGDVVLVEVMVSDWEPELLRAIQAQLVADSLTSGSAGFLHLFDADADDNDVCDPGNEPYCPACVSVDLHGIFVDSCRPDFFGAGLSGIGAVDLNSLRLAWSAFAQEGNPDPGSPRYVGTFVLQADVSARGTFTLTLSQDGTLARNADAAPLDQPTVLIDGLITIRTGRCCSPEGDCVDGVTAVECPEPGSFQPGLTCAEPCACQTDDDCEDGDPCTRDACEDDQSCSNALRMYGDIAPCGGDGVVDLDDILAVLDAFAGFPSCPDGCP